MAKTVAICFMMVLAISAFVATAQNLKMPEIVDDFKERGNDKSEESNKDIVNPNNPKMPEIEGDFKEKERDKLEESNKHIGNPAMEYGRMPIHKPPSTPANEYRRGCTKGEQCRGGR